MKELNSLPAFQRMASRPADRTLVYIRTRAQLVVSALMLIIALPNHGGETESPPGSHHELTNLLPLQERSVAITSAPGAPLDMVFIFGSEIVSPQKQMIHLPAVLEVHRCTRQPGDPGLHALTPHRFPVIADLATRDQGGSSGIFNPADSC